MISREHQQDRLSQLSIGHFSEPAPQRAFAFAPRLDHLILRVFQGASTEEFLKFLSGS